MKLLFFLFLSSLSAISLGSNTKLVNNYYNNSDCSIQPYKIDKINLLNSKTCYKLDNLSICIPENNKSIYRYCYIEKNNNLNKTIECSLKIILTILILSVFFILYKWCCEYYLDYICINTKNKIKNLCFEEELVYNHL